ncbi:integral membrane protein DGCR2/IDD-like [Amphibalanus amphitrite]|uniref:integral membrane protein DGCR2/IDD-like n=1 Tax=Amphibalanus amphitrite TaxID=1232801 RepID=UPI001C90F421|nr:integral membrane protein DGCR2/IDD-like [Amphibalanus amphitrite]XP_043210845.1 integral membrane protein DGCR2/IDD-like [Amphibalanus amphitrite]XP_043210846.1 integral membrane protein DGCR2/IDD-like [Amphibalanus amphitrite]
MTKLQLPGQAEPRLCTDLNGRQIRTNERYTPWWDECTVCTCDNGEHKLCQSVMCAAPRTCRQYQLGKKCCEFICLDGGGEAGASPGYLGGSKDLGLRLVASAVTAVLSLALLLFLVYRLRQRRHRGPPSLRPEETYNLQLMNYLRGSGYLGAGGGRGSHDFYYEQPPPPYSVWKPPQVATGEAPPPYSEAIRLPELRQGVPPPTPPPTARTTAERWPQAVLVLAPAVTAAGAGEIPRQRAAIVSSDLDPEAGPDSDPELPSYPDPEPGSDCDGALAPDLSPEPEPAARRARPQPPERVLQRFSLHLQLDCSDSATSSSPTLSPDGGTRPGSVTSSSSTERSE